MIDEKRRSLVSKAGGCSLGGPVSAYTLSICRPTIPTIESGQQRMENLNGSLIEVVCNLSFGR
jgi:hypothetical protein